MGSIADERSSLERVRAFDLAALAEVYDTFSPAVYRCAMQLLGEATLVEECLTDAFGRLLDALEAGGGLTDYSKAYVIAHNWITDYYRHARYSNVSLDADPVGAVKALQHRAPAALRRVMVHVIMDEGVKSP